MITLFFGLVAAAGNVLGGAIVLRLDARAGIRYAARQQQRILHLLLNLGAGFLLAVTVLEMIPAALTSIRPNYLAAPVILTGYLLIYLIESTVSPHVHVVPDEDIVYQQHDSGHTARNPRPKSLSRQTLYAALVGLTIHSFFDGVAIGSGAQLSRSLGWLLMIAIVLHKIPEGATVASLAMLSGLHRRAAITIPLLLGAATIAGVFLVSLLKVRLVGSALGLAAGVTLYIAATDLVPHARDTRGSRGDAFMLIVGVALFVVTDLLLRTLGLG